MMSLRIDETLYLYNLPRYLWNNIFVYTIVGLDNLKIFQITKMLNTKTNL